jgi:hypothetical protein
MPIKVRKSFTEVEAKEKYEEAEDGRITKAKIETNEIENWYLPEVVEKEAPIFCKLYNIGERYIPTCGHFLGLVATVLATMGLDEPRQSNLGIGAVAGEGKTLILSQFRKLPFVNFFTRTTYAKYLLMKCGWFLSVPGKELPVGVRKIPRPTAGEPMLDKSGIKDQISYYFDIITEGEGIFTMGDVPKLLQLWNQLTEQGTYEGGDSFSGWYRIGVEPQNPVKHGLIIAATITDFQTHIIRQIGWATRMVLGTYSCSDKENRWISDGIMKDYISSKPDISYQVKALMEKIPIRNVGEEKLHYSPVKVRLTDDVSSTLYIIRDILMTIRDEKTMKRAGADANRLVKGFALLNGRDYTKLTDVIILKALLTMSKKIYKSENIYSIGTRMHFQTSLCLDLLKDYNETMKFITERFKNWEGKALYEENDIKRAIHEIGSAEDGKWNKIT